MEIDDEALDAIRELINIGVGRAAGMLNEMTGCTIRLRVPTVRIVTIDELAGAEGIHAGDTLATVTLTFEGPFCGLSALAFPPGSAAALVMLLSGEPAESPELDALRIETLKEVGNIILNSVMGSIANILEQHLSYSLPRYLEINVLTLARTANPRSPDERVILADTHFTIEDREIEGSILLILEVGSLESLLNAIQEMSP
ncbi:chemotaxis protein CheC [Methanoregula sp.]|uniref:chemotaxis protein CheC n=1 Tax=Methanoregula sp. TaxID=2052170 RepID=UPI0023756542|nr:chemotaxis protein CheC [Methanoregula sp.]MDD1686945.1 chemotaxis protein CheC [Methanoregula sp.]